MVIAMDAEIKDKMIEIVGEWPHRWAYWRDECLVLTKDLGEYKRLTVRLEEQTRLMRKELDAAMKQRESDAVTIGKLLDKIEVISGRTEETSKRLDKASEVVTSIRRDLKGVPA